MDCQGRQNRLARQTKGNAKMNAPVFILPTSGPAAVD